MTDFAQREADKRMALWKERFRHPVTGKQAIREFEEFVLYGDEQLNIAEILDPRFTPEKAHLLRQGVSWLRVRQLASGKPLDAKERALWQDVVAKTALEAECLSAIKLTASDGTVAWFTVSMNGFHLRSSVIDAAGPFWTLDDLVLYGAFKVKSWYGWWQPVNHGLGEELCRQIEKASRKPRQSFHALAA